MWKRKPPGDIAQAVIELMEDPGQWRAGLLRMQHLATDLQIRNDWCVAVVVGGARFKFEGRDQRAVDKAYRRLRKRLSERRQAEAAQRVREAMKLDTPASAPVFLPTETIEQVEARVRRLRAAVLQAAT